MFGGFNAPRQRIALRAGAFFAEIWPELGGAVACFERHRPLGLRSAVQALFRSTRAQPSYLPTDLACFPLLPYSRIADGCVQIGGSANELPGNFAGSDLHGVGWIRPWFVQEQHSDRCSLCLIHDRDADWPCAFTAVQEIVLTESGLELRLDLINSGERAMPYGIGHHPYVRRPAGTRIFAPVEGLSGDVHVAWPDGSGLRISCSPALPFLVVHSVPERDFVCLEPVSQRPNAFNAAAGDQRAAGVAMLEPCQSTRLVQRFDYLPAPSYFRGSTNAR